MAKLVFGLNLSLDGYVDHQEFAPDPVLFRHFIEQVRGLTGSVYGRRMYEVMRYWDEDRPDWSAEQHEFAAAWRRQPKWVVSRSLKSVGPNATLVEDDIEAVIRGLKAQLERFTIGLRTQHAIGTIPRCPSLRRRATPSRSRQQAPRSCAPPPSATIPSPLRTTPRSASDPGSTAAVASHSPPLPRPRPPPSVPDAA